MPEYQASVELPQKVVSVFEYVRRPQNLVRLLAGSTDDFEFRVPNRLEQGSVLEFSLRRFGMRIDVLLEVVDLIDQKRIFLQQRKGPFRRWLHEYTFLEPMENKTLLTEKVVFDPPSGFLGIFITNAGIMEQLKRRIPNGHSELKIQFQKVDQ